MSTPRLTLTTPPSSSAKPSTALSGGAEEGRGGVRTFELPVGEALLLGRNPDADALDEGEAPWTDRGMTTSEVDDGMVSRNHLVAWRDGDSSCLWNPGSRNDSLLRLPRRAVVRVEGVELLEVVIAPAAGEGGIHGVPEMPRWDGPDGFGPAVTAAVERWLRSAHVRATVRHVPRRAEHPAPEPSALALADGGEVLVRPEGTVDQAWPRALEVLWRFVSRQNLAFLAEDDARREGLVLASPAIREAYQRVVDAARRGVRTLLLMGPTGSGKEGLARAFHRFTGRAGACVTRNCALMSRELGRVELFGAEPGAYTGATRRMSGAVEQADGGTLFLDEIADLAADVQPMLLRFLDSGEFERMGDWSRARRSDARVVCATHRDLRALARGGQFRPDLWYRLSVEIVEVPPLSRRPEDVAAYLRKQSVDGASSLYEALAADALGLLAAHPWDGNFRELQAFVGRLPRAARPSGIDAAVCRKALEQSVLSSPNASESPAAIPARPSGDHDELTRRAMAAYVEDHGGQSPAKWDDFRDFVELYLKPLTFVHLSGGPDLIDDDKRGRERARALDADRGTAAKQLTRYRERFSG